MPVNASLKALYKRHSQWCKLLHRALIGNISSVELCFCMTSRPHKCLGFLFWGLEWITQCAMSTLSSVSSRWDAGNGVCVISSSFIKIPFNIRQYYSALLHGVIQALLSFAFLWQSHLMIKMYYICFLHPVSPVKTVNILVT